MLIFKMFNKENNSKGILILTHKELHPSNPIFKVLHLYLTKLRERYLIFLHNGCVNRPYELFYVDLYLTTSAMKINNKCISFTSRNFLDKTFNNNKNDIITEFKNILKTHKLNFDFNIEKNKVFDFICVNRSSEVKKTLELLKYTINYSNIKKKCICFVIIEDDENNIYYKEIVKYYKDNKNNYLLFINGINLQKIKNSIWSGLTRKELAVLYNLSKVYLHGCEAEGESRTIHEALCCGCMVMAKENMCGGGLDYLNNKNSILYNEYNYFEKMEKIIEMQIDYIYDIHLFQQLNETFTIRKFSEIIYYKYNFDKVYNNINIFLSELNTDNLMDKLPSHDISVSWYIQLQGTSDIKTIQGLKIFKDFISEYL